MEKFRLKSTVTETELQPYQLPMDPLVDKGVIFLNSFNAPQKDGSNCVMYQFKYFDENDNICQSEMSKQDFETFFEEEI